MNLRTECSICGRQCTTSRLDYGNKLEVECDSCGLFKISQSINKRIADNKDRYIIAGHLYATKDNRLQDYLLDAEKIKSIMSEPFNKPANITEQLDILLLHIERISPHIGAEVFILLFSEYPIVYARNQEEFRGLFNLLDEMQYIKTIQGNSKGSLKIKLLYKGYQRIQEFKKTVKNPERCFVAMPINGDQQIESLYQDVIQKVLKEEKYKPPFRVDEERKTDYITNKIIANIRISSLMIAEVTPLIEQKDDNGEETIIHNANVYYEVGFARGIGIPIIYLCREDRIKYLPFDTKTISHLSWDLKNINKLNDDLKYWMEANVKK